MEPDAGGLRAALPETLRERWDRIAAIDARMSELYVGHFELRDGDAFALSEETLAVPETVAPGSPTAKSAMPSASRSPKVVSDAPSRPLSGPAAIV